MQPITTFTPNKPLTTPNIAIVMKNLGLYSAPKLINSNPIPTFHRRYFTTQINLISLQEFFKGESLYRSLSNLLAPQEISSTLQIA